MQNVLLGRTGSFGFGTGWLRRFSTADMERALLLLERLGLTRCDGLRVERLSARDRRIVAIARALMQEPDILLADDLTEGLDARAAHQIMRLLVDTRAERRLTTILCVHNVQIARTFVPRLVAIRDGAIAYDGAARDLTGETVRSVYGQEYWTGAIEHVLAARPLIELRAKAS
jgi:phosphonate transport system ATP-binding protein